jgi:hydroxyacylglutathione hydrolase
MLSIKSFVFNPFSENTYIVFDESKEAVIIDPGCYEQKEQRELLQYITNQQLCVKYLLNTHGHIDHVLGNDFVKENFKVPLFIHRQEEKVLLAVKTYASNYGFAKYKETTPDQYLAEGDLIAFGNTQWKVLFVPGHSPGHIAFYDEKEKVIFSGDVLFEQSIGRTDLPGGDFNSLIESIQKKLFVLPDEVVVYAGHGSPTQIGKEKITNPYCSVG